MTEYTQEPWTLGERNRYGDTPRRRQAAPEGGRQITIAMQLGLSQIPMPKPTKSRRHLMDGSKAEAKVDRTVSATQAMHARRAEIVAMLDTDGPMFRGEIQEGLTMPATPDQLKRDMTELVKSGVIRARECDGTHRIYWRPGK